MFYSCFPRHLPSFRNNALLFANVRNEPSVEHASCTRFYIYAVVSGGRSFGRDFHQSVSFSFLLCPVVTRTKYRAIYDKTRIVIIFIYRLDIKNCFAHKSSPRVNRSLVRKKVRSLIRQTSAFRTIQTLKRQALHGLMYHSVSVFVLYS